jgi:hypothetical protein
MRKDKQYIAAILSSVITMVVSCKETEVEFQQNNCKKNPDFVKEQGFDPKQSFFSTSDIKTMGLLLLQSPAGNTTITPVKSYQHPSWQMGGWLGPVLLNDNGDLFTAPAPFINVLNNPVSKQNTIYKVNNRTAVMEEFLQLPIPAGNSQNAYGIIGLAYLCESNILYVSTVAGSDRLHERGAIYAIDIAEKKIVDELTGIDAMGMGITYVTGERRLFFGTGRSSAVFSIALNKKGHFSGNQTEEFSLQDLGQRGDDKVRRIVTDQLGNLTVLGMEFNFNLIAPREKQQTSYQFQYMANEKKWTLVSIN